MVMQAYLNLDESLPKQRHEVLDGLQQLLRVSHIMYLHEEEAQLFQTSADCLRLCLYTTSCSGLRPSATTRVTV